MCSSIITCVVNSELKVERQDSCSICDKLCNLNSLIVKDNVLELLKFIIEEIDTTVLENSQICEQCFNQLEEAGRFKIVHREYSKRETNVIIQQEEDNDKNLVMCYNCKNFVSQNSCGLLFDTTCLDMFRYFVIKEDLEPLVNPKICNTCQESISNLQAIMSLLSVYDTRNIHKIEADDEFVEEGTKLDADVIGIKEDKLDIEIEDMEIKTEEVILETDNDNEDSGEEGIWDHRSVRAPLNNMQDIKKHPLTHKCINDIEMLSCQICRYQVEHTYSLPRDLYIPDGNGTEIYKCFKCGFRTKSQGHFKKHNLLHKKVGLFRCSQCEYKTTYKTHIETHVLIHTNANGPEIWSCQQCEYQTKHKCSLKSHMLIHKGGTYYTIVY